MSSIVVFPCIHVMLTCVCYMTPASSHGFVCSLESYVSFLLSRCHGYLSCPRASRSFSIYWSWFTQGFWAGKFWGSWDDDKSWFSRMFVTMLLLSPKVWCSSKMSIRRGLDHNTIAALIQGSIKLPLNELGGSMCTNGEWSSSVNWKLERVERG